MFHGHFLWYFTVYYLFTNTENAARPNLRTGCPLLPAEWPVPVWDCLPGSSWILSTVRKGRAEAGSNSCTQGCPQWLQKKKQKCTGLLCSAWSVVGQPWTSPCLQLLGLCSPMTACISATRVHFLLKTTENGLDYLGLNLHLKVSFLITVTGQQYTCVFSSEWYSRLELNCPKYPKGPSVPTKTELFCFFPT